MASRLELERLIHEYQKRDIPPRFLYAYSLEMADEMGPDEFIEAFPEELRPGLEECVIRFPLSSEPHVVLRPDLPCPRDETLLALRSAFTRRQQVGDI